MYDLISVNPTATILYSPLPNGSANDGADLSPNLCSDVVVNHEAFYKVGTVSLTIQYVVESFV